MEINKHNFQDIKSIKYDDRIIFNENHVYSVASKYLRGENCDNEDIFEYIHVDKYDFCEKAYGYHPDNGFCPECKLEDYPALLRLIKAIFRKMYPCIKKKDTFEETLDQFEVVCSSEIEKNDSSKPTLKTDSSTKAFNIKVTFLKPKIIL